MLNALYQVNDEDSNILDNVIKLGEDDDGSSYYEINDNNDEVLPFETSKKNGFYENLVEDISPDQLSGLCTKLLEGIEEDNQSRQEWEQTANKGLNYLGIKVEEAREVPFMHACSAFDTTLLSSLLKSCATTRAEFFPEKGPCQTQILGESFPQLEKLSSETTDFSNYYLTSYDEEYYPDSQQLIWYRNFFGMAFRKVYVDPILNRPISRFIKAHDLIINNNATSILNSNRITHVKYLDKKEIMIREKKGIYKNTGLFKTDTTDNDYERSNLRRNIEKIQGINTDNYDKKSLYKFYIVHADVVINKKSNVDDKEEMPLPYIVTISAENKKIVSVIRNWKEQDENYQRINHFVGYPYITGFGLYGLGIIHLVGSNAITQTSILRQTIDAGSLKNFPGGLRAKGFKMTTNDKAIGPAEFREIDTGGLPIQQSVMLMPYAEPSSALIQLRQELKHETQEVSGVAELPIGENNPEMPVGTTLALLETNSRIQSDTLRTFRDSLAYEFKLLFNLFKENLEDNQSYPFSVPGKIIRITKHNFDSRIQIIPKSDPSMSTTTQRILKTEALLKLAQTAPQLHNIREIYYRMYTAMNIHDIDRILPPEEEMKPTDPITENVHMMTGKPVKAFLEQDHKAHILVHSTLTLQENSEEAQIAKAHIKEHMAMQYYLEMQLKMGAQLPRDPQQLQDPNIQNTIALAASQVAAQEIQQQQQMIQMQLAQQEQELKNAQQQAIDEKQLIMADIQQKAQHDLLRNEESKLKAETESYKATLKYETDKEKMETDREIAEQKGKVQLVTEEMKHDKGLKAATDAYKATLKYESDKEKLENKEV